MTIWQKLILWIRQRPLVGHASWMLSGGVAQAGIAFGANLVLMRLLQPEDFGRFALILANINIVAAILNFRVYDLILRVPDEEFDQHRLASYWSILFVESCLIAAGSTVLLYLFDLLQFDALLILGAVISSHWIWAQMKIYERSFAYRELTWIQTGSHTSAHIISVIVALFGLGPIALYLRLPISFGLHVLGLKWLKKLHPITLRRLNKNDLRNLWAEVSEFWTEGMLQQLFDRLVIISIGFFGGEKAAGYYSQANRLALVPMQLLKPLTGDVLYNYFSHRITAQRQHYALARALLLAGIPLLAVTIASVLWADTIIPWVFGAKWQPVAGLLVLLSGVILFGAPIDTLRRFAMGTNRLKPFIIIGRGVPLLILGLGIAAIQLFYSAHMLEGIAISVSLAYALSAGLASYYYFRQTSS